MAGEYQPSMICKCPECNALIELDGVMGGMVIFGMTLPEILELRKYAQTHMIGPMRSRKRRVEDLIRSIPPPIEGEAG